MKGPRSRDLKDLRHPGFWFSQTVSSIPRKRTSKMSETTKELSPQCREARSLLKQKDYDKAIPSFEKAIEKNPHDMVAHDGLGMSYFSSGNLEKAAEQFERIMRIEPTRNNVLINLGAIYNKLGDYNKAIASLQKGLQRNRNCVEGYYNLGIAQRALKQNGMAVSAYKEALRVNPEMAEAHVNLANIYLDMKNNRQAVFHYEKALEIKPGFKRAEEGIVAANKAIDDMKNSASPFGRLVDVGKTVAKSVPKVQRQLTNEERLQDRKEIFERGNLIVDAAEDLAMHLAEEFEIDLLELNRAVSQGVDEAPQAMIESFQNFQKSVTKSRRLRKELKRRVLELRAHEETMNTPESKTR